ncbi:MAG: hypothetical protein ACE5KL_00750 [Alphaproteobacteria bacterium]
MSLYMNYQGSMADLEELKRERRIYVHEKLSNAVQKLATGTGRIEERLFDAAVAFITLPPRDFPNHLKGDFEKLRRRLTSVKALGADKAQRAESDLIATLSQMSDDDAVGLAGAIVRLEGQMRDIIASEN